jgi:hypothetical protein
LGNGNVARKNAGSRENLGYVAQDSSSRATLDFISGSLAVSSTQASGTAFYAKRKKL